MSSQMEAGRAAFFAALEAAMRPEEVAAQVFDAIEKEQFYIVTHPEWMEVVKMRTDKLLRLQSPENPTALLAKIVTMPRAGQGG